MGLLIVQSAVPPPEMGYTSSLLDRRSLDNQHASLTLTQHDLDPPTRLRSNSSGSARPGRRRPQASALLFRPLTPILSPSLTTPPSSSDGFSPSFDSDPASGSDYLTRGRHANLVSAAAAAVHTPVGPRLWTSTPPTPPNHSPHQSLSDTRPHVRSAERPVSLAAFPAAGELPDVRGRRRASTLSHTLRTSRSPSPMQSDDHAHPEERKDEPPSPGRVARRPPMFHIPSYITDDDNGCVPSSDGGHRGDDEDGLEDGEEDASPHESEEDRLAREQEKIRVRKYHALMELLETEVGYLQDLRTLVTIYLQQLQFVLARAASPGPGALTFGRITPLTPHSRSNSGTQIPAPPTPSGSNSGHGPSSGPNTPDSSPRITKDKDKALTRTLLSDQQVDLLRRNAEQLLEFHEWFVEELHQAVTPLGFPMQAGIHAHDAFTMDNIDKAITAVMTKFTTQASLFNIYQLYCSRQTEATDVVRKAQRDSPVEWDAYEQRCSVLVIRNLEEDARLRKCSESQMPGTAVSGSKASLADSASGSTRGKRRHSTSSMAPPAYPAKPPSWWSANASAKLAGAADSAPGYVARVQAARLSFLDYLVKPVQRICRYPLLFDQLKTSGASAKRPARGETLYSPRDGFGGVSPDIVVESAAQAMRHVVSLVDEARDRQDVFTKSALIVSRLVRPQGMSAEFLDSLGPCLLAGSLDVIQEFKTPSGGVVDAKYLGAFLYTGGYLLMTKVGEGKSKSRVYDPRHWFSLAASDLEDVGDDEAILPASFRLVVFGRQFNLTAACQREKHIWISTIRQSLTSAPEWVKEPQSSLRRDSKEDVSPPEEGAVECIPETSGPPPDDGMRSAPPTSTSAAFPKDRAGTLPPPTRRASSTSVKSAFASTEDVLIRRASPAHRKEVNRALADVLSSAVSSARFQAETHDEALFAAPRRFGALSRTNSGLSMTGMGIAAKDRLRGRDSVLIMRRGSSFADSPSSDVDSVAELSRKATLSRSKSRSAKAQMKKALTLTPAVSHAALPGDATPPCEPPVLPTIDLVSPLSDGPAELDPEPEPASVPHTPPATTPSECHSFLLVDAPCPPQRSRSMVGNVRDFFYSGRQVSPLRPTKTGARGRPASPAAQPREPSPSAKSREEPPHSASSSPARFKWLSKEALRKRVWSAPDPPKSPGHRSRAASPISEGESPLDTLPVTPVDEVAPPSVMRRFSTIRRKSMLPVSLGDEETVGRKRPVPPSRRRSIKHALFFNRPDVAASTKDPPDTP